jgi:hypothetical protein
MDSTKKCTVEDYVARALTTLCNSGLTNTAEYVINNNNFIAPIGLKTEEGGYYPVVLIDYSVKLPKDLVTYLEYSKELCLYFSDFDKWYEV